MLEDEGIGFDKNKADILHLQRIYEVNIEPGTKN